MCQVTYLDVSKTLYFNMIWAIKEEPIKYVRVVLAVANNGRIEEKLKLDFDSESLRNISKEYFMIVLSEHINVLNNDNHREVV